jgi:RNA polymerase sigma-70 factor, ECF subfamily
VLSVIYLVFNEGYSASVGDTLLRSDLSAEAIRLGKLVLSLLPNAEVMGLVALMLLHESRRDARTDLAGNIILLDAQDKNLWNQDYIKQGIALVNQALETHHFGAYTIQAAIAAVHAQAQKNTDWDQIVGLYTLLHRVTPSPVVELNRAVAIAMRDGEQKGLAIIDDILLRGELIEYHKIHSTRGELLSRLGRVNEAISAFNQALCFVKQAPEQRFLLEKLVKLQNI